MGLYGVHARGRKVGGGAMTPKSRDAILYAYEKGYRVLHDGTLLNAQGRAPSR